MQRHGAAGAKRPGLVGLDTLLPAGS